MRTLLYEWLAILVVPHPHEHDGFAIFHIREDDSAHAGSTLLDTKCKALTLDEPLVEELDRHRVDNAGPDPVHDTLSEEQMPDLGGECRCKQRQTHENGSEDECRPPIGWVALQGDEAYRGREI